MATAVPFPVAVELFYSYAHSDELLCEELQKHLAALKRSGLIRDWYDRKIEPGDEWGPEIHAAMERAGIILLLISADFLASKYIFEVELPFALKRHDSGSARVIPILLRPVEWHDSPFAKLQVLPSEARAVTLWPNRDEAFSDIAGKLRELIYSERLRATAEKKPTSHGATSAQDRVLDAAIASSVVIDEPTDVVTMVRTTESGGLKAILRLDRTYSPVSDDVRSETFELDFPVDESGTILPTKLELALESPGFDPPMQRKKIRIPPEGDSSVSVFMLTPKRAGKLRLNLAVISDDVEIGSRALLTTSVAAAEAQPALSYGVSSLQLVQPDSRTRADRSQVAPRAMAPPMPMAAPPPAPGAPTVLTPPRQVQKAPSVPSRSRRGAWIGMGSAVAAIALVSSTILWTGGNAAHAPQSEVVIPAPSPPPESAGLSYSLTQAKRAVELTPNNAQAHLTYAQLLEKANLNDQALQEYKKVQALNAAPEIRSVAARRVTELERRRLAVPSRRSQK